MKENFDFVSMDNYSADMDDLGKRSAAAIRLLRKERDQARQMVAAIVATVGKVSIPERTFHGELPPITQDYDAYSMTYVLRT